MACGYVVIFSENKVNPKYELQIGDHLIGSGKCTNIRIKDTSILPVHVVVRVNKSGLATVFNKCSKNPIKVNGKSVFKSAVLRHLDELKVHHKRLQYFNEELHSKDVEKMKPVALDRRTTIAPVINLCRQTHQSPSTRGARIVNMLNKSVQSEVVNEGQKSAKNRRSMHPRILQSAISSTSNSLPEPKDKDSATTEHVSNEASKNKVNHDLASRATRSRSTSSVGKMSTKPCSNKVLDRPQLQIGENQQEAGESDIESPVYEVLSVDKDMSDHFEKCCKPNSVKKSIDISQTITESQKEADEGIGIIFDESTQENQFAIKASERTNQKSHFENPEDAIFEEETQENYLTRNESSHDQLGLVEEVITISVEEDIFDNSTQDNPNCENPNSQGIMEEVLDDVFNESTQDNDPKGPLVTTAQIHTPSASMKNRVLEQTSGIIDETAPQAPSEGTFTESEFIPAIMEVEELSPVRAADVSEASSIRGAKGDGSSLTTGSITYEDSELVITVSSESFSTFKKAQDDSNSDVYEGSFERSGLRLSRVGSSPESSTSSKVFAEMSCTSTPFPKTGATKRREETNYDIVEDANDEPVNVTGRSRRFTSDMTSNHEQQRQQTPTRVNIISNLTPGKYVLNEDETPKSHKKPSGRCSKDESVYKPILEDITPVTPGAAAFHVVSSTGEAFRTPENTPGLYESIQESAIKSKKRHRESNKSLVEEAFKAKIHELENTPKSTEKISPSKQHHSPNVLLSNFDSVKKQLKMPEKSPDRRSSAPKGDLIKTPPQMSPIIFDSVKRSTRTPRMSSNAAVTTLPVQQESEKQTITERETNYSPLPSKIIDEPANSMSNISGVESLFSVNSANSDTENGEDIFTKVSGKRPIKSYARAKSATPEKTKLSCDLDEETTVEELPSEKSPGVEQWLEDSHQFQPSGMDGESDSVVNRADGSVAAEMANDNESLETSLISVGDELENMPEQPTRRSKRGRSILPTKASDGRVQRRKTHGDKAVVVASEERGKASHEASERKESLDKSAATSDFQQEENLEGGTTSFNDELKNMPEEATRRSRRRQSVLQAQGNKAATSDSKREENLGNISISSEDELENMPKEPTRKSKRGQSVLLTKASDGGVQRRKTHGGKAVTSISEECHKAADNAGEYEETLDNSVGISDFQQGENLDELKNMSKEATRMSRRRSVLPPETSDEGVQGRKAQGDKAAASDSKQEENLGNISISSEDELESMPKEPTRKSKRGQSILLTKASDGGVQRRKTHEGKAVTSISEECLKAADNAGEYEETLDNSVGTSDFQHGENLVELKNMPKEATRMSRRRRSVLPTETSDEGVQGRKTQGDNAATSNSKQEENLGNISISSEDELENMPKEPSRKSKRGQSVLLTKASDGSVQRRKTHEGKTFNPISEQCLKAADNAGEYEETLDNSVSTSDFQHLDERKNMPEEATRRSTRRRSVLPTETSDEGVQGRKTQGDNAATSNSKQEEKLENSSTLDDIAATTDSQQEENDELENMPEKPTRKSKRGQSVLPVKASDEGVQRRKTIGDKVVTPASKEWRRASDEAGEHESTLDDEEENLGTISVSSADEMEIMAEQPTTRSTRGRSIVSTKASDGGLQRRRTDEHKAVTPASEKCLEASNGAGECEETLDDSVATTDSQQGIISVSSGDELENMPQQPTGRPKRGQSVLPTRDSDRGIQRRKTHGDKAGTPALERWRKASDGAGERGETPNDIVITSDSQQKKNLDISLVSSDDEVELMLEGSTRRSYRERSVSPIKASDGGVQRQITPDSEESRKVSDEAGEREEPLDDDEENLGTISVSSADELENLAEEPSYRAKRGRSVLPAKASDEGVKRRKTHGDKAVAPAAEEWGKASEGSGESRKTLDNTADSQQEKNLETNSVFADAEPQNIPQQPTRKSKRARSVLFVITPRGDIQRRKSHGDNAVTPGSQQDKNLKISFMSLNDELENIPQQTGRKSTRKRSISSLAKASTGDALRRKTQDGDTDSERMHKEEQQDNHETSLVSLDDEFENMPEHPPRKAKRGRSVLPVKEANGDDKRRKTLGDHAVTPDLKQWRKVSFGNGQRRKTLNDITVTSENLDSSSVFRDDGLENTPRQSKRGRSVSLATALDTSRKRRNTSNCDPALSVEGLNVFLSREELNDMPLEPRGKERQVRSVSLAKTRKDDNLRRRKTQGEPSFGLVPDVSHWKSEVAKTETPQERKQTVINKPLEALKREGRKRRILSAEDLDVVRDHTNSDGGNTPRTRSKTPTVNTGKTRKAIEKFSVEASPKTRLQVGAKDEVRERRPFEEPAEELNRDDVEAATSLSARKNRRVKQLEIARDVEEKTNKSTESSETAPEDTDELTPNTENTGIGASRRRLRHGPAEVSTPPTTRKNRRVKQLEIVRDAEEKNNKSIESAKTASDDIEESKLNTEDSSTSANERQVHHALIEVSSPPSTRKSKRVKQLEVALNVEEKTMKSTKSSETVPDDTEELTDNTANTSIGANKRRLRNGPAEISTPPATRKNRRVKQLEIARDVEEKTNKSTESSETAPDDTEELTENTSIGANRRRLRNGPAKISTPPSTRKNRRVKQLEIARDVEEKTNKSTESSETAPVDTAELTPNTENTSIGANRRRLRNGPAKISTPPSTRKNRRVKQLEIVLDVEEKTKKSTESSETTPDDTEEFTDDTENTSIRANKRRLRHGPAEVSTPPFTRTNKRAKKAEPEVEKREDKAKKNATHTSEPTEEVSSRDIEKTKEIEGVSVNAAPAEDKKKSKVTRANKVVGHEETEAVQPATRANKRGRKPQTDLEENQVDVEEVSPHKKKPRNAKRKANEAEVAHKEADQLNLVNENDVKENEPNEVVEKPLRATRANQRNKKTEPVQEVEKSPMRKNTRNVKKTASRNVQIPEPISSSNKGDKTSEPTHETEATETTANEETKEPAASTRTNRRGKKLETNTEDKIEDAPIKKTTRNTKKNTIKVSQESNEPDIEETDSQQTTETSASIEKKNQTVVSDDMNKRRGRKADAKVEIPSSPAKRTLRSRRNVDADKEQPDKATGRNETEQKNSDEIEVQQSPVKKRRGRLGLEHKEEAQLNEPITETVPIRNLRTRKRNVEEDSLEVAEEQTGVAEKSIEKPIKNKRVRFDSDSRQKNINSPLKKEKRTRPKK